MWPQRKRLGYHSTSIDNKQGDQWRDYPAVSLSKLLASNGHQGYTRNELTKIAYHFYAKRDIPRGQEILAQGIKGVYEGRQLLLDS